MKCLFMLLLTISLIGCSALGIRPERVERVADYVRGYVCSLPPEARALARADLERNGIKLDVDCEFKAKDAPSDENGG